MNGVSPEEVDRMLALVERQREKMEREAKLKRELAIERQARGETKPNAVKQKEIIHVARTMAYTPELHAKIVAGRKAGRSWETMAKELGVSRKWVKTNHDSCEQKSDSTASD